jgi:hypothetical protein
MHYPAMTDRGTGQYGGLANGDGGESEITLWSTTTG